LVIRMHAAQVNPVAEAFTDIERDRDQRRRTDYMGRVFTFCIAIAALSLFVTIGLAGKAVSGMPGEAGSNKTARYVILTVRIS
jgi:hypothetical protein